MLQILAFPQALVPTVTIADILQLKQLQRFDLMGIPAKIIDERSSGAGMYIADVRLVDGTQEDPSTTTEYASLPLTIFFKNQAELTSFKTYVGSTPMLFMSLSGSRKEKQVEVSTIKKPSNVLYLFCIYICV